MSRAETKRIRFLLWNFRAFALLDYAGVQERGHVLVMMVRNYFTALCTGSIDSNCLFAEWHFLQTGAKQTHKLKTLVMKRVVHRNFAVILKTYVIIGRRGIPHDDIM